MNPLPPLLSLAALAVLAFGVGFATQRGSVCGVLAARQIVEMRKASRLVAFVMASLWALVIVVPLAWLVGGRAVLSPSTRDSHWPCLAVRSTGSRRSSTAPASSGRWRAPSPAIWRSWPLCRVSRSAPASA